MCNITCTIHPHENYIIIKTNFFAGSFSCTFHIYRLKDISYQEHKLKHTTVYGFKAGNENISSIFKYKIYYDIADSDSLEMS